MTVLINSETRVVVQGITGREGSFHTKTMLNYGTKIVAGVTPGKGGSIVEGVPVYDSVKEALRRHPEIDTSIVFVPARYASEAVYEAIEAGLNLVVIITEGIPVHESMKFTRYAKLNNTVIVGPNCPGVISPGESKVGIMPGQVFSKGRVGIVSRSGTLTYEIAYAMTKAGIGQSTSIGIGGDPVLGTTFIDALEMFREDDGTDAVVLIGEIGGDMEERAARYIIEERYEKPVVAYIAGRTAPPGKRMGHAGAIISMGVGDAASKIKMLREAGVDVAELPSQIPGLLKKVLKK
ncbi:MAG: succinate--CoA ligase subunit alpha [Aigarchaeota archaeon]|nr:succinate--CoA ligase subunit alpha [Aigarchaeota archaeon]MCX8192441.1 succinate--CoA ligase subunit alpha [Nitrososphaeria archaeon]MDW7986647.1 succinate--CoA ligase subunit alpha [Nitrososphaerota archaeon]